MATLIVETGLGVLNANSYADQTYANNYHAMFNNTDWVASSTADNDTALIQATNAVELLYGPNYISSRVISSRGPLLWPRLYCFDNNGRQVLSNEIPTCLKNAVCEVALMYQSGIDIYPPVNSVGKITSDKSKFGDIEFNTTYSTDQPTESYPGFRKIDLLLAPILTTGKKKTLRMSR